MTDSAAERKLCDLVLGYSRPRHRLSQDFERTASLRAPVMHGKAIGMATRQQPTSRRRTNEGNADSALKHQPPGRFQAGTFLPQDTVISLPANSSGAVSLSALDIVTTTGGSDLSDKTQIYGLGEDNV